ncbi:MAG: type II toxin-antitoxin system VapC family toxin [Myxococcaceae bacterium]
MLDTNVLSEFMRESPRTQVADWLRLQSPSRVFTTAITHAEILYGVALLPEGKRKQNLAEAVRAVFAQDLAGRILPFDTEAAPAFAVLAAKRKRMGRPITNADAQIAAICISHEAVLATRNVSDFDGCEIRLLNPFQG